MRNFLISYIAPPASRGSELTIHYRFLTKSQKAERSYFLSLTQWKVYDRVSFQLLPVVLPKYKWLPTNHLCDGYLLQQKEFLT
jgi:hypothetical protein